MADWGGIARAVEEGLLDAESGGSSSGGGIRDIAEALTGSNFAGFKMRDIFDKDRWTRRERVNQGRRLEETGIPDYTYDYNPTDRGTTTGLGSSDLTDEELRDPRLGPHGGSSISAHAGRPRELDNIRQWGTQNPNMPGSMALDPTWAGGVRGAGLGAEMTPGDRLGEDRDLSGLSRDSRFAPGTVPGNITGTRGYLPGRMSVGEARRARAMRNMSQRDRQEAGFGEGPYSEFDRISRSHDTRHDEAMNRHRQGQVRTRRAHRLAQLALGNTSGTPGMGGHPSQGAGGPNWAALEEDMAMREIRERQFEGRDSR